MALMDLTTAPTVRTCTTSTAKTAALAEGWYLVRNLSLSADGVYVKAGAQASVTAATTDHHLGAGQSVKVYLSGTIDTIAGICPTSTATLQIARCLTA